MTTSCRTVTTDMVLAAIGALVVKKYIPSHTDPAGVEETWRAVEAALRAALDAAPWCQHGVPDFEFCEPCNREYKRAAREYYPEEEP